MDAQPHHPPEAGPPRLQIDKPSHIATLTLRRPAQRNSLTDDDLHALLDAIAQVDAEPAVRVLVLRADTTGQPRPVFSAGYHVGGFDQGDHGPQLFERVPEALERARPLTLCAMNGSVYGGATDLVLACDLRLALAGTELRMPACMLGLHYYPSGLRRYVNRLGLNLAKRAFLTGQALPVQLLADAAQLFEQVADGAQFDAAVQHLATRMAGLAPLAAQATKQSLNEIAAGRYDDALLRGREAASMASADFAEGRAAFAARRPPRFSGR